MALLRVISANSTKREQKKLGDLIRFNHHMETLDDDAFAKTSKDAISTLQKSSLFVEFRKSMTTAVGQFYLSKDPKLLRKSVPTHVMPCPSTCTPMSQLPKELSFHINTFLDLPSLMRFGRTSRRMYLLCHDENSITDMNLRWSRGFVQHMHKLTINPKKLQCLKLKLVNQHVEMLPYTADFLNQCLNLRKLQLIDVPRRLQGLRFPCTLQSLQVQYKAGQYFSLFCWEKAKMDNLVHVSVARVRLDIITVRKVFSKLTHVTSATIEGCSDHWLQHTDDDLWQVKDNIRLALGQGLTRLRTFHVAVFDLSKFAFVLWNVCVIRVPTLTRLFVDLSNIDYRCARNHCGFTPLFDGWVSCKTQISRMDVESLPGIRSVEEFCVLVLGLEDMCVMEEEEEGIYVLIESRFSIRNYRGCINRRNGVLLCDGLSAEIRIGMCDSEDVPKFKPTVRQVLKVVFSLLSAKHLKVNKISLVMDYCDMDMCSDINSHLQSKRMHAPLYESFQTVQTFVQCECDKRGRKFSSKLNEKINSWAHMCSLECHIR